MTALALIFTLAAIGISESSYLIRKRVAAETPLCFIGENCTIVLESKYHNIFFVPNDVLGLIFYIFSSLIAAFLVIGLEPLPLWSLFLRVMVGIGSLISIFLTYLQWRVIKSWCFWCLMSAFTTWLMAFIMLVSRI